MNQLTSQNGWEQKLTQALGDPPTPDFAAWAAANLDTLDSQVSVAKPEPRRSRISLMPLIRVAAVVLVIVTGAYYLLGPNIDSRAFAAAIQGVDTPKTITWTTTFYTRVTSADGKRTWIAPERRLNAYRSPGQYRQTRLDEKGETYAVQITDVRVGRTLLLDVKAKKAVLSAPKQSLDARGPFAWVGEAIRDRLVANTLPVKSVSMQGKKQVDSHQATVVRAMIDEGGTDKVLRRDFMFDESSKQLVGIWLPNEKQFDVESAPDRDNPAEEQWSISIPLGYMEHEIIVDSPLDPNSFSLDAPSDYALEKAVKPTVTEDEMIAYLGASAKFNAGQFPDSPFQTFDTEKFNASSQKAETERNAAEKEMIAQHDKFLMREIYRSPIRQFMEDHVVEGSFQYVGAEVKVDGPKQLVCWYRLTGSNQHRGVFSDLSVRELNANELPFEVKR